MSKDNINLFNLAIENLQKINILKDSNVDLEDKFPGFARDCNELCIKYVYDFLTAPLKSHKDFTITADDLKSLLGITKDYEKFYNYMLEMLVTADLLKINDNLLLFKTKVNPDLQISSLIDKYPMFQGTLTLLDHCVKHYSSALSETIPAISVLYPEGNVAFIEEIYTKDTAEYSELSTIKNIAIKLITSLSQNLPLKILEVGGGRGQITRDLLARINKNNLIKYHFTDISRRFVIDMRRYAVSNNFNNVECTQLDITKSPLDQGFNLKSYDIVIGLDVVHATENIEATLKILKSLIKDSGILCLLETTNVQHWQNLTMGLTKGWWLYNDNLRKSTPLLSPESWKKAITHSEFTSTMIITMQNINSDAALIIAA